MSTQPKWTPVDFKLVADAEWMAQNDEWRRTGYRVLSTGSDFSGHAEVVVIVAEGYNKKWAEAGTEEYGDKVVAALTASADLYAALEKCAGVLSGADLSKSCLIEALEAAQSALRRARGKA
jgi:hypothetical protein